jgi:pimeloyl-ACP methyl ester carboxylesterase
MKNYPEKIYSVILESPLPPNIKTFENITNNFRNSINSLFDKCANDPGCKTSYPTLKQDFVEAIKGLDREPLIIPMSDKTTYPSGKFVINSQDMLLGLQQALYGKAIYPVIPLLIEQIKHRNVPALSNFVESMANGIKNLHYGLYYTVICKECMPFNSLQRFEDSAKGFFGGLTFYKDEFNICNIWNQNFPDSRDSLPITSNIPVLILSGEQDPMAPPKNAEILSATLPSSFSYIFQNVGHFVSNEAYAVELMTKFLKNPFKKPDPGRFIRTSDINFAVDIHINNGIPFFAKVLSSGNKFIVYKIWFMIAAILLLVQLILSARNLWITSKVSYLSPKLFYALSGLNALLSIFFIIKLVLIIIKVRSENYFILGFGLPQKYYNLLLIPYLILSVLLIQISLLFLKNNNGIKKLLPFFIIPYLIFIFYFNLYY